MSLGEPQRCLSCRIGRINARAGRHEKPDHLVRIVIRRRMQSGLAMRISSVDVAPGIQHHPQRLDRVCLVPTVVRDLLRRALAKARSHHQGGGAVLGGHRRVSTRIYQQPHHLRIRHLRGDDERCRSDLSEPPRTRGLQHPDLERVGQSLWAGHPCIRVRPAGQNFPSCAQLTRRTRHMQSIVASLAGRRVSPPSEQPERYRLVALGQRQHQRRDAVRRLLVHVSPNVEQ